MAMMQVTAISDIVCGKTEFNLTARVIHLWSIPDRTNTSEEGSIHMVLVDAKGGNIQASIRKHLIPKFKSEIEEGSAYAFENFMVATNDQSYKATQHKYRLNFMHSTKAFKISTKDIPAYHFDFMPFQSILAATREDKLLDVIGHVVEKGIVKETEKNGQHNKVMDLTLEDLESNRIHCTLWDQFAERMQQFLANHDSTKSVIVILQLGKLKKYFGEMGVSNAFFGTKMMLNADLPVVANYKSRLDGTDLQLTPVVSQMTAPVVLSLSDDLLQTQRMTIGELIEATQKCVGSVLVRTCELETDLGWYYQACSKCASKVITVAGGMYCDRCKKPKNAIPRFKVHVQVIDNTGSTTFTLFDRAVSNVLGRNVQDLLDSMDQDMVYPPELDIFVDKRMLFKVEVGDANLFRNWRSYTVKKLTQDDNIINQFLSLHGINMENANAAAHNDVDAVGETADKNALEITEGGDSNDKDEFVGIDSLTTPTSNSLGKRSADAIDVGTAGEDDSGASSTTKEPKITCVKLEKTK